MNTPTNQNESLHPILLLVKPRYRDFVNLPQVLYILKLTKEGNTSNEIARRYYAEEGKILSVDRIRKIQSRFKGGLKYV